MIKILDFLKNHYQLVIYCFTALFSLLIVLFKKRPSSSIFNDVKFSIISKLPEFIEQAEIIFDDVSESGVNKKELVIGLALTLASRLLKRSLTSDEDLYLKEFISEQVELILKTPQKKEDN